jgi:hypothetical protein
MSKRFTDSAKWGDPWFSDLPPLEKLFWMYLLDNCDHAGIWKVHMKLAEFHLGCNPSLEPFKGRYLQLSEEKIFIPGFIEFQYGTLNESNRVHKSVIDRLKKEGAYKALNSPLQRAKEKDKEKAKAQYKEKAKEKEQEKETSLSLCTVDSAKPKKRKGKYPPGYGSAVWNSYSEGFERRYGTKPKRNAKQSSLACQLRERLGDADAAEVARYYPSTSNSYHAARGHTLALLVADAEKVWTEWRTGRQITQAGSREQDRLRHEGDGWAEAIAEVCDD